MSAAGTLDSNNALVYQVYHHLSHVFTLNHDQSIMMWEIEMLYIFNIFSYLTNSFCLNPKMRPPLINSHSFMKALTNQKSRTVSSWLLIGLNLPRMWINWKWSHFWAPCCKTTRRLSIDWIMHLSTAIPGGSGGVSPGIYAGMTRDLSTLFDNCKPDVGGLVWFCTFVAGSPRDL